MEVTGGAATPTTGKQSTKARLTAMSHTTPPDAPKVWGDPVPPAFPLLDSYTPEQVAYLMRLAYRSGQQSRFDGEIADLYRCWYERADWRPTADEMLAQRRAGMESDRRAANERFGRPHDYTYRGGPVPWDDTAGGQS
jgi:hypothetical protein